MNNEVEKDVKNVFEFIKTEKTAYQTRGVPVTSNWEFKMFDHINKAVSAKNSKFIKGSNDDKRPYKNIIIPIANVNYRTEGFDVKDVMSYVDDPDYHHLSLLTRKFHYKWAIENGIDLEIDNSVESHFDFGLILAKNVNDKKPEIVPLQRIAFCDQSDVLSGAICEKHDYSIDQLLDMKGKWYDDEIDNAILQAQYKKNVSLASKDGKTPSKYVEIYELHGTFPKTWLNTDENEEYIEEDGYCPQLHIVTYYKNSEGKDAGICLFKGIEKKPIYKAFKRTNRYGTACGMGGIEELLPAQLWTNFSEIHLQKMLAASAKVITKTTDKKLASNNNLNNIDDNGIVYLEEGKQWEQMVIQPFNKSAFDNYVNSWEQSARVMGSASDPALGLNPISGTPLGTTEIITNQGEGIHEYRQGRIAAFWHEIYTDWVTKYLVDDLNKGDEWLDELSIDELREVADRVAINVSNQRIKDAILSGKTVSKEQQELLISIIKEDWMKSGKSHFIKIMKDEFKKLPIKVKFNVAGKQKDMIDRVQKLNSIFRTVFANPAILQNEAMAKLFNNIVEASGLDPMDFSSFSLPQPQLSPMQPQQMPPTEQPLVAN